MNRATLLALWLACVIVAPILLVAMFFQAAAGSTKRAKSMAVAYDCCGNALFGGKEDETISQRTGLALLAGKRWARNVAPCIDAVFGKGHCLQNAMDLLQRRASCQAADASNNEQAPAGA